MDPIRRSGKESWGGFGQTLVDALDTLYIAGLFEEFDRGVGWVAPHLTFKRDYWVSMGLVEYTV